MRYFADVTSFVAVLFLGMMVFGANIYALMAAIIVAGATECVLGDPREK